MCIFRFGRFLPYTYLVAENDGKLVVHLCLETLLGEAGVAPVQKQAVCCLDLPIIGTK